LGLGARGELVALTSRSVCLIFLDPPLLVAHHERGPPTEFLLGILAIPL
jgi:hypothetical protein